MWYNKRRGIIFYKLIKIKMNTKQIKEYLKETILGTE